MPTEPARAAPPARRRYSLLGVPIDVLDLDRAVAATLALAEQDGPGAGYVCVRDVNGVIACQDDPGLRDVHERAALVTPDGMPVVWWGRLQGFRDIDRVYGPDLMSALCRVTSGGGPAHFLCGGEPGVAEALALGLAARHPGLRVAGTWTPPFRPLGPEEYDALARRIERSGARITWIGLSSPKQERFMAELAPRLRGGVMLGVGAAFDFLSGRKPQAPRWLQRTGFEWAFRLATEPRRLGRRYLVNNTRFVALVLRELARGAAVRRRAV